MINSAQFDPDTLATVKPGVDGALAEISLQMERYLNAPAENAEALEAVCAEFHRLLGVLKMVGLDGLVIFCTEFELALSELKAKPKQVSDLYRDVLRRALFAVTHFLDALADGADNATLRLFPQYQELQQLRGLESAFEQDLFYPNLAVQLPQQILKPPRQDGALARLKWLRGQYQQGLLRWLRQEDVPAALHSMQKALGGAIFCEPQDDSRGFWWVSFVLLDCLKLDGLPPEMNVRKLLGRIDQQMRLVSEGKASDTGEAKPVLNEMLYMIGRSHVESDQVKAIRQVYSLDKFLPEASTMQVGELDQELSVMRDQLRVAEESWDLCVQGDKAACEKFSRYAEQLKSQSEKFDHDTLQYLARQIQAMSDYAATPEHARPIALDMAMALLLLGSGIENYNRLGSGFQEQARILSERMQAVVKQQPEDAERLTELVDLHYQMEQQGDVTASLANEMLVNLQHVEEGLNTFFNDTAKRGELNELLRLLSQIQGGLRISSLKHAEQLLSSVQNYVRRFSQSNIEPRPVEKYALADAMSSLENYMQQLSHGQAGDVSRMQLASANIDKLDQAPVPAAPPVTVKPDQIPVPVAPVKDMQPQVSAPAVPVVAEQPQAPVPAASAEFEQTQIIVPAVHAEVEQHHVATEVQRLSDEEQELLDIFLEEAQEVLGIMRDNLETCQLHPENHEAMVTIRRGFHTLKGSGRMVGLTDLGEVAWCVERAMNKWLQDKKPSTPGLLHFISVAEQSFSDWVEMLKKQGVASIEANDLIAVAQKIESGVDLESTAISEEQPGLEQVSELEPAPVLELCAEMEAGPAPVSELEQMPVPGFEQPTTSPQETEPAPTPEEEVVVIGGIALRQDLFKIASLEAMQNVNVLRQQYNELSVTASPTVQYDFMRAAHTLDGVCRTMGFDAVVSLAHTLEEWLRERVERPSALSKEQMQMLEQSISALDEMVQSICNLQMPKMHNDLVNQLTADKGKPGIAAPEPVIAPAEAEKSHEGERKHEQLMADIGQVGETAFASIGVPETILQPDVFAIAKPADESVEAEKPQIYDDVDDQLLPVFLEEAEDLAPKISQGLRCWREHPHDEQLEHSLKRLLHTLKGSSRMVGAMRIGEIAHEMETHVLSAAKLREEAGYWDKLESEFDRINALLEELRGGKPVVVEVKPVKMWRRASDQPAGAERRADRLGEEPGALGNMLRVRADVVDRLVNEASEISVVRSRLETEMRVFKEGLLELTASVKRLRQQLREVEIQAESQIQARVSLSRESAEQFDPLEFDRFTRLQELTRFMNESVHDVQTVQHTLLKNLDETAAVMLLQGRLNRELQQGLMNVRMVSFNNITDRLYRIVRQTCKELNKRANLELQGTGVELDRSVLEKMIAPFEHLLRNSIVHGLENDQQRVQSGKNPIGEIRLSIRQESNEVVFEFSDDGAGLSFAKLREKAIARGTIRADEAVSDDQLAQLIFIQGLSTATEITEIAGRGIGMDVVRSEIAALGGRIDVSSKRGQGTQFIIHLPLTLAVTHVVMVRSGESTYAIPSTMVEQVRQVKMADMEALHREQKVDWQGNSYPLYYLPHLLGNMEVVQENQPRNSVLLLRSGEQRVALHVDELLGNQEAMVKSIGSQLARLPWIAGATVLGNGKVVLILNPPQLAQRVGVASSAIKEASTSPLLTLPLIMVVDDSLTVRKITSRMLTRAGYQVVTATDGVDALEKLEEMGDVTPDVMLLDIEMPRMDGFALVKHLRRYPRTQNLPIIMISSRTADKHRDYALQLGVNTYLGKPYQEDELLQNIADFVAVHKLDS